MRNQLTLHGDRAKEWIDECVTDCRQETVHWKEHTNIENWYSDL